ncbi:LacI family DNA-binding transcriptional regulator [Rhodospirillum sp. A1_3_36]|uniref:LacI family DNA-binding transcriptional regulator n=1 Tax=Rhodospirillum sp. A1_3_36 TaxID=3391666 RepID=UPI0039A49EE3
MTRKKKVTLKDVADLAGVAIATADRVLNGRGGVRVATEARVLEAARRLGLNRNLDLIPKDTLRFAVVMNRPDRDIYMRIQRAILDYGTRLAGKGFVCNFLFYASQLPSDVARRIESIPATFDGAIVVTFEHTMVTDAMERLCERMPVVTLLSDLPQIARIHYAGSGNWEAGKVAGDMMGRFIGCDAGQVMVLTRLQRYTAHREREIAFRQVMAERYPGLRTNHVVECDTGDGADIRRAMDYVAEHGPFQGLYNISSWNIGVVRALREAGLLNEAVLVTHGVNRQAREMLRLEELDLIIEYAVEDYACQALGALLHYHGRQSEFDPRPRHRVEFFTREHLPPRME